MLDYIFGKAVAVGDGSVVLELGGVGIKLAIPVSLSQSLQEGKSVKLFTALSLKNEELRLYGFGSVEERAMFEKLQTVTGVGPATALNVLSRASLASLYQAIVREDLSLFKKIKGVGQKTAQRIVLELKSGMQKEGMPAVSTPFPANSSLQPDAVAALLALGYTYENAYQAVLKAWEKVEDPSLDKLVREALGHLGTK